MRTRLFLTLFVTTFFSAVINATPTELKVNKTVGAKEEYQLGVLKLALGQQNQKFTYVQSDTVLNEAQMTARLESGDLDVMWAATKNDYENALLPIRIPLFKGLLGHRVFLIREGNQHRFNNVNTLEDLQQLRPGQGRFWADTQILKNAGIDVVTTTKYENLFHMLEGDRFDYFPRGVHEPWSEITDRPEIPMTVEKRLLLIYPLAAYLFVKQDNHQLANKIRQGLLKAIDNGEFDQYFYNHQVIKSALEQSNLANRTVLKINNPFMPEATPYDDKKLWFDINAEPQQD